MPTAKYDVSTSLRDDMNEGWVWIRNLKNELDGNRRIIRVKAETGKSIFCEALYADVWYMEKWNERWDNTHKKVPADDENLAFISSWYRRRLGIGMGPQNLTIDYKDTPRPFWWQLHACLEHPQAVVLLATLLAVIGLGLGTLALGLGVVAVTDWRPYGFWIGWVFVLLGAFVMARGLLWGWRR
jgi:hypothetical protein